MSDKREVPLALQGLMAQLRPAKAETTILIQAALSKFTREVNKALEQAGREGVPITSLSLTLTLEHSCLLGLNESNRRAVNAVYLAGVDLGLTLQTRAGPDQETLEITL